MNIKKYLSFFLFLFLLHPLCNSQDLMDILDEEDDYSTGRNLTTNTFLSTRIINGQSVENPYPGDLIFVISHHFGQLNRGAYEFWGLDQATIRIGLEYGINERLAISAGRSSYEKTFDGFFKYKLLQQQNGRRDIPVTVSLMSGIYAKSLKWQVPERDYLFKHRLSYVHQVMIARKFSRQFSAQLTPAFVHQNLVRGNEDPNTQFVLGSGLRYAITPWVTLNTEYFYRFNPLVSETTYNTFSVGFDFDTGGHVFQLHFTNAQPMFERAFLTETRGSWSRGDIYFGFNIIRVFSL
jgi:hypothetical protein